MDQKATRSFLLDLCDYHLDYLGCENAHLFAETDTILLYFYSLTAFGYACFLLLRYLQECVRNGKRWKEVRTDLDLVSLLAFLATLFHLGVLGNIRNGAVTDKQAFDNAKAEIHVRTTLVLELMANIMGSVALAAFVNAMVKTAVAASLFDPIKIGTTTVDVRIPVKLYRLFVLVFATTFCILFSALGTSQTYQDYVFFRRLHYGFPICTCLFVSMPLVTFFGSKVLHVLYNSPSSQSGEQLQWSWNRDQTVARLSAVEEPRLSEETRKPKRKEVRVLILQLAINGAALMYLFTAMYYLSAIIVNEIFVLDPQKLLATKIVFDVFHWIYFTWFLIVLYPKLLDRVP